MFLLRSLILDRDFDAAIKKCQLAQPLRENIETELADLEDLIIRLESYPRAALFGFTDLFERRLGIAAPITLLVNLAVTLDFNLQGVR